MIALVGDHCMEIHQFWRNTGQGGIKPPGCAHGSFLCLDSGAAKSRPRRVCRAWSIIIHCEQARATVCIWPEILEEMNSSPGKITSTTRSVSSRPSVCSSIAISVLSAIRRNRAAMCGANQYMLHGAHVRLLRRIEEPQQTRAWSRYTARGEPQKAHVLTADQLKSEARATQQRKVMTRDHPR